MTVATLSQSHQQHDGTMICIESMQGSRVCNITPRYARCNDRVRGAAVRYFPVLCQLSIAMITVTVAVTVTATAVPNSSARPFPFVKIGTSSNTDSSTSVFNIKTIPNPACDG
ncbi:hypothetical protein GB937_009985 [Aspergillus fischeri]|nr:hypothetical protein GB937_009985 [Aspergillus fischeri]